MSIQGDHRRLLSDRELEQTTVVANSTMNRQRGPSATLPAGVELIASSLASWSPTRDYDLITCVHGIHYLGDKLGLLARAASWLAPDGLLIAHIDPDSFRLHDGHPAARPVLRALRAAGYRYNPRRHLLTLTGHRTVTLPFAYLGADPNAGPNYTGQPAVASYYRPNAPTKDRAMSPGSGRRNPVQPNECAE